MKKIIALLAVSILLIGSLAACGSKDDSSSDAAKYKDGTFTAEGKADDKGWIATAEIVIKDGKITEVDLNANNKDGGKTKKEAVAAGEYPMVAQGKAMAEWDVQIAVFEQAIIDEQAIPEYEFKEGVADGVSGASIASQAYLEVAQKALDKAKK